MTAVAIISIVIFGVAALAAVLGLFFLLRGIQRRRALSHAPYNVGRQEARRGMRVDLLVGVGGIAAAAVFFAIFFLLPGPTETEPAVDVLPSRTPAPEVTGTTAVTPPTDAATPLPTATATVAASATSPLPTPTATLPPTATPTPQLPTATVVSGVGVWLRDAPGVDGEQIEWLLEGTVVTVLEETAVGEEFQWQRVLTDEGIVGWVAVPFIEYSE